MRIAKETEPIILLSEEDHEMLSGLGIRLSYTPAIITNDEWKNIIGAEDFTMQVFLYYDLCRNREANGQRITGDTHRAMLNSMRNSGTRGISRGVMRYLEKEISWSPEYEDEAGLIPLHIIKGTLKKTRSALHNRLAVTGYAV